MPKFSVITPVHLWSTERVDSFLKTIDSIKNQTFKDFEWIIVDDGSTADFLWERALQAHDKVYVSHEDHEERVIAYNKAFVQAKGEWFVLLDSDDELTVDALEQMSQTIDETPNYLMFNFGCLFVHKDGSQNQRDPFEPKEERFGHEEFGGGNIVNGTFIWHKSIYQQLGGFGPQYTDGHIKGIDTSEINYGGIRDLYLGTPYDFSAWAQIEFPEIRKYFMVNVESEPNKVIKELGNPWGQDFYLFYKYTRMFHSMPVRKYLSIIHLR